MVQQHFKFKGVKLHLSEKVTAVVEKDNRGWIRTETGQELPADLVIISVGIKPNTQLAEDAGLSIGPTGGIAVNELMQTSDPNIFAAGDCVESRNLVTGKPALFPMGSAANKQGRAAGANAFGRSIAVKGFTGTVIVKVFDLGIQGLFVHITVVVWSCRRLGIVNSVPVYILRNCIKQFLVLG